MNQKDPELLAPAGSIAAFKAAVANGAAAVYMGGQNFNARASADNISDEDMPALIRYAHLHGVKIYVTVNTLIHTDELLPALQYIKRLYDWQIDGIIIQDLGLLALVRKYFPALHLSASTQMTAHNSGGIEFLSGLGIDRVILSRELSLKDIKEIREHTTSELEVFVHGALCICYSGQCLMSSMIGGRSGNRGRCAQPCRLRYKLAEEGKNGLVPVTTDVGDYLLSPRDLYGYELLTELLELDVDSLKIEGRMKRPEYVATVVRNYHQLLDSLTAGGEKPDSEKAIDELLQIFNRDCTTGFWQGNPDIGLMSCKRPNNRGVYLGRVTAFAADSVTVKLERPLSLGDGLEIWVTRGGRSGFTVESMNVNGKSVSEATKGAVVAINADASACVGDRVFKTYDKHLMERATASYESDKAIPVSITLTARLNNNLTASAFDDHGNIAEVIDDYIVPQARTAPSTYEYIKTQLERMGGSGFYLDGLEVFADEGIMLPASVLNALRRNLVEKIAEKRLALYRKTPLGTDFKVIEKEINNITAVKGSKTRTEDLLIAVMVSDAETAAAVCRAGAEIIYLSPEKYQNNNITDKQLESVISLAAKRKATVVQGISRIYHDDEVEALIKSIGTWQDMGIKHILSGNTGIRNLCQGAGFSGALLADTAFNILNPLALQVLTEQGFSAAALSSELSFEQLKYFAGIKDIEKEVLVHGALPLMVSEYCLLSGVLCGGNICTAPCRTGKNYALKDEKGFAFPLRADTACRTHVFNSRELCMSEDLSKIASCGIERIRLDLRLHSPKSAAVITECYLEARSGGNLEKIGDKLRDTSIYGFTKGHYYRGV